MIDGVIISPLRQMLDERGKVMHMFKVGDPAFQQFGEIYFSCVYPEAIKGWHIHKEMTLNYAVPHGHIKFVLYDDRPESPTRGEVQEIFMGSDNYCLVTVPPMVWNGFKGIGMEMAIVANCASIPHSPDEIDRRDPFDPAIPYDWAIKHR
ncbi:dTDP-4-dehydrorhamnose 3,5-epimerase family protein [Sulfurirhabdus autotrophica]|uniref:dTDP-4-dehydrorhamnose 3,5-epimerase n=1 Tax=Sulfurirhabdus autotrophica TaxID=1706046 RepID=A0A4R3Y2K3_9PROT|nr:dTDP-4-dehydrorhamnose 3,5-epimerase family protein [Sulfurirhabdus autotrophica]TCV84273.1 dTDP-4-dehydrorhamnose 3,5-epimerase [Sulfurirhabdus autotrophica]